MPDPSDAGRPPVTARSPELAGIASHLLDTLERQHRARELALGECRMTIRLSSLAIRSIHRQEEGIDRKLAEAGSHLRSAQDALRPYAALASAGFLHDAAKEYVEACLTWALVRGSALDGPEELDVEVAAWLCGLTEAASELRRYLLDRLREGDSRQAESLMREMEDVYDLLVAIDYPDAITGGLRRHVDALRAVLERSRADVTTTMLQEALKRTIESSGVT